MGSEGASRLKAEKMRPSRWATALVAPDFRQAVDPRALYGRESEAEATVVMAMGRRAAAVAVMGEQWPAEALGSFSLGGPNRRLCGCCAVCCRRRRAGGGGGARRAGWPKPAAILTSLLRVE